MKLVLRHKDLAPYLEVITGMLDIRMPSNVSMAVLEAIPLVAKKSEAFNQARTQLIESRCKKDEHNKPVFLPGEERLYDFENESERQECSKEVANLVQQNVEIEVQELTLDDLKAIKGDIAPAELDAMRMFVKQE